MFGLLNNAVKSYRKKQEKRMTIIMLGCDGAGKTTLLHTLGVAAQGQGKRRPWRSKLSVVTAEGVQDADAFKPAPTIGFDEQALNIAGYACTVYDLGGGRGGRTLWPSYLDEVHGLVFVLDAADVGRLNEVREVLHNALAHESVKGKPVLIICNKQDLPGSLSVADLSERLGLSAIKTSPYQLHACVARSVEDARIFKGFKWLGGAVASDYAALVSRVTKDVTEKKRLEELERAERKRRIEERKAEREREREAKEAAEKGAAESGQVAPHAPRAPPAQVEMQRPPPSPPPVSEGLRLRSEEAAAPIVGLHSVPSTPSGISVYELSQNGVGRRLPSIGRPPALPRTLGS